jgi:hypothetical protein
MSARQIEAVRLYEELGTTKLVAERMGVTKQRAGRLIAQARRAGLTTLIPRARPEPAPLPMPTRRRNAILRDRNEVCRIALKLGFVPSGTRLQREHRALFTRMSKRQPGLRAVLDDVARSTRLKREPHGNKRPAA